jgi:hypothetical protein
MRHFSLIILLAALQSCGFAQVRTDIVLSNLKSYRDAATGKVTVNSAEQNEDLQNVNRETQAFVVSELEELFTRNALRHPAAGETKAARLRFDVDVQIVYGSRGKRYITYGIGGAGEGRVASTLRVVDADTGETQYQAAAESTLNVGFFGGSMRSTIQENIEKLLDQYPN